MKRIYVIYGVFLGILLVAGAVGVALTQATGVSSALGLLGKGEGEYARARQQLLLGTADPSQRLVAYARNRGKSERGRVQALHILADYARQQVTATDLHGVAALVNESSRDLRLAALKAMENARVVKGFEPAVRLFRETQDTAELNQCFLTLGAASTNLYRDIQDGIARSDDSLIDSCMQVLDSLPAGKGKAFHELVAYYRRTARYDRAADLNRRLGILKRWWVIGGWENQKMAAFHDTLPPERVPFDPGQTFPLPDNETARWFQMQRMTFESPLSSYFDPSNLLPRRLYSMAYFLTFLQSPDDRDGFLLIGSDDGIKVWLNDSLLYSNLVFRGVFYDNDIVKVHLRKGTNRLLIKLAQDVGGWGLLCRLVDGRGEALPGVTASFGEGEGTSPAQKALARLRAGGADAEKSIADMDEDDDELVQGLVTMAIDETEQAPLRLSALRNLRLVNRRRAEPAGEPELIALAQNLVQRTIGDNVTAEALQVLADMNSVKALDVALAARSLRHADVIMNANRLVDCYCGDRLRKMKEPESVARSGDMAGERAMGEMVSLLPLDPWVKSQIARFYRAKGDTARSLRLAPRLSSPSQWLVLYFGFTMDATNAPEIRKRLESDEYAFTDKRWIEARAGTSAWKAHTIDTVAARYNGSGIVRSDQPPSRQGPWNSVVATRFESDRADSVTLVVGLPVFFTILFNGQVFTHEWNLWSLFWVGLPDYRDLRSRTRPFEVRVPIRRGTNTMVITMPGFYLVSVPGARIDIKLLDRTGRPLAFDGTRIDWTATAKDPT